MALLGPTLIATAREQLLAELVSPATASTQAPIQNLPSLVGAETTVLCIDWPSGPSGAIESTAPIWVSEIVIVASEDRT